MPTPSPCPVCGFQAVPAGADRCPQCDADLACFRILDSIPEAGAPRFGKWGGLAFLLFGLSLAAAALLFTILALRLGRLEDTLSAQRRRLEVLEGDHRPAEAPPSPETAGRLAADAVAETAPAEKPEGTAPRYRVYEAAEEDTLWKIAQRFLGEGRFYPVLLELNPHAGIYGVGEGLRLRIPEDPAEGAALYGRIIVHGGGTACMRYTVREADTLDSLSERFYEAGGADRIEAANPGLDMSPGTRILIPLE